MYFTNDQGLAGSSALCLPITPDFGSTRGWPVRQIWIFSSDPFILKGREQTQISPNLKPTPLSPETAKLSEDTPELWKTLGFGLWFFPRSTSQEEELRVKTELPCRKCTMYSYTHFPLCGQCSAKPSSDTCRKETSPKAFAFSISSLQKINTLQRAKQFLFLPSRQAYATFPCNYLYSCPRYHKHNDDNRKL